MRLTVKSEKWPSAGTPRSALRPCAVRSRARAQLHARRGGRPSWCLDRCRARRGRLRFAAAARLLARDLRARVEVVREFSLELELLAPALGNGGQGAAGAYSAQGALQRDGRYRFRRRGRSDGHYEACQASCRVPPLKAPLRIDADEYSTRRERLTPDVTRVAGWARTVENLSHPRACHIQDHRHTPYTYSATRSAVQKDENTGPPRSRSYSHRRRLHNTKHTHAHTKCT